SGLGATPVHLSLSLSSSLPPLPLSLLFLSLSLSLSPSLSLSLSFFHYPCLPRARNDTSASLAMLLHDSCCFYLLNNDHFIIHVYERPDYAVCAVEYSYPLFVFVCACLDACVCVCVRPPRPGA